MDRSTSIQRVWTSRASRPAAGLTPPPPASRSRQTPCLPNPMDAAGLPPGRPAHHEIGAHLAGRRRRIGFVARAFPGRARVHHALSRVSPSTRNPVAKSRLGFRSQFAEVPHHRGKHVLAGLQEGRRVHRFVPPVEQVAARRSPGYPASVHEQLIAVVAADVDHEPLRGGRQLEGPAEMVHTVLRGRSARHGDPTRAPQAPDRVRAARLGAGALLRRCAGNGCRRNQRGGAGFQQKTPARRSVSGSGWRVWHALETVARRERRVNSRGFTSLG